MLKKKKKKYYAFKGIYQYRYSLTTYHVLSRENSGLDLIPPLPPFPIPPLLFVSTFRTILLKTYAVFHWIWKKA